MDDTQDSEEDIDSETSNLVPINDQLKMCSDILADLEKTDSKSMDHELNDQSSGSNELEKQKDKFSNDEPFPNLPSTSGLNRFSVCKTSIACVPKAEQSRELQDLGVSVYDQTEFESHVLGQVDKALKEQEEKRRMEEAKKELKSVQEDINFVKNRLNTIDKAQSLAPKDPNLLTPSGKRELSAIKKEQENKLKHLKKLEAKQKALQACIAGDEEEVNIALQANVEGEEMDEETLYHLKKVFTAKETEEERLIRTGEMTPFGTIASNNSRPRLIIPEDESTDFDRFLLNEVESHKMNKSAKIHPKTPKASPSKLTFKPSTPAASEDSTGLKTLTDLKAVHLTKHKVKKKIKLGSKHATGFKKKSNPNRSLVKNYHSDSEVSDFAMEEDQIVDDVANYSSDDVYMPGASDGADSSEEMFGIKAKDKKKKITKKRKTCSADSLSDSDGKPARKKMKKFIDDGNQEAYLKRIKAFEKSELIKKHEKILESEDGIVESDDDFTEFEENFKVPNSIWNKLYKYQQTAVRWLWELHQQNCGGIIGDEMGLGKTIQMIAFLVGLSYSKLMTHGDLFRGLGPVILVCPATVMHQWVKEFHTWWPPFRVAVLHESGSFNGKKDSLIYKINKCNGVLITSYAGVVQHQESLVEMDWHYIILDEGHKIRNPDAQATLAAKQFKTPHRIILSGSPIQNNLKELWSLFDFIFPGKLGTLPVFMQQFSIPIVLGGYANANQVQVQTAYKCATVLRNTIRPYLLRRMKADVKMSINLPNKSEQVLFCQLTEEQVNLYKGYITSKEVNSILDSRLQVFVGLINLRKICNHPDLFDGGPKIFKDTDISQLSEAELFGYYKRSGKMIVVEALLKLWFSQGHRVLLFTQSRQMMNILEIFVKSRNYKYMKMDGGTSISSRQPAIHKFNSDTSIFVFLLTTRVGGLGVNLTGANRVILYDPDWNPSTDAQARERAWRIGQEKQVTIYRLLTAGTIEEKIYHRQIFKQFVTNRVLKDPRQRRFFKSNDLYELFTYNEIGPQGTETSAIFAGTGSEIKPKSKHQSGTPKKSHSPRDLATIPTKNNKFSVEFSEEKQEKMKQLARKLSLELLKKSAENNKDTNGASSINAVKSSPSKSNSSRKIYSKNSVDRKSLSSTPKEKSSHKKRKPPKIEGENINFVVKKSVFKPPQEDTEKDLKQDDYVLSKLFKKSGVHTALKHDTIVESSDPDYMIVEGEANRVAKEAIKALRESRRLCARAEEGVPTWTGQHGQLKQRFGQKKKLPIGESSSPNEKSDKSSSKSISKKQSFDGKQNHTEGSPSSKNLLSAIKNRKVVFGTDTKSDEEEEGEAGTSAPRRLPTGTEQDELLVEIRNFIAFRAAVDGQASTSEIIDAFKDQLPVHQTAIFKAMLSKICDFTRSSSGDGMWHLKPEFR